MSAQAACQAENEALRTAAERVQLESNTMEREDVAAETINAVDQIGKARFAKVTGLRPTEYRQQVRVMRARDALETTMNPIDQIACEAGYTEVTAFRRVFQRFTSLTPSSYRQRFGVCRVST